MYLKETNIIHRKSTILRRRGARLGDLHIYRRQDSPAPPPPPSPSPSPDVGSDSDDEGDELGGPDTPSPPPSPSPTQTTFPPGVPSSAPPGIQTSTTSSTPVSVPSSISTSTSSPAIQPTTSLDNTGTEIPDASRTSLSASPATEETTVLAPSSTSGLPDNTQEQQQPELGQSTSQPGLMGSGGVIAMATLSKAPRPIRRCIPPPKTSVLTPDSWLGSPSHRYFLFLEVSPPP